MIAWNDAYLLVEDKLAWKFWGVQIWAKQVKTVPEIIYFAIFFSLVY